MSYFLSSKHADGLVFVFIMLQILFMSACPNVAKHNEYKNLNKDNQIITNKSVCPDGIICPGIGVGKIVLGDSEKEALKKFGNQSFWRFNFLNGGDGRIGTCPEVEMNWGDANAPTEKVRNGVRAYLNSDEIYMIKVDSFSFSTPEGITVDNSLDLIRQNHPHVKTYLLKNSNSKTTGSRDLIYLVEQEKGIAFELYYNKKEKKRLVGFIYIFTPDTKFFPLGCLYSTDWEEINEPYLDE